MATSYEYIYKINPNPPTQTEKDLLLTQLAKFNDEINKDKVITIYKKLLLQHVRERVKDWRYHVIVVDDIYQMGGIPLDGSFIPFDVVHYGFQLSSSSWDRRLPYFVGRNPFVEFQKELYAKTGLVILDESDPASHQSYNISLGLYREIPYTRSVINPLWHGLNVFPLVI